MRLLLADDHNLVRDALMHYVTRVAPDIICYGCENLGQVIARLSVAHDYDMVILDFRMPGMNGLDGLRAVCDLAPSIPVAIISGQIDRQQAQEALGCGAAGIIQKDLRGTALLGALRLMAAGEIYVPSSLAGNASPNREARIAELRTTLGGLTVRELDCVRLVVRGMGNRELGSYLSLTEITVKGHLNRAYKKMGAHNRADAVRISLSAGIDAI